MLQAFNVLDVDGNGYITLEELRTLMGSEDDRTIEQAIKEADSDGDGQVGKNHIVHDSINWPYALNLPLNKEWMDDLQISYREFCELLKKNNLRLGSMPQKR